MTQDRDLDYYLKREAEERAAMAKASNTAIRDAHLGMAERYADRVWSLTEDMLSQPTVG